MRNAYDGIITFQFHPLVTLGILQIIQHHCQAIEQRINQMQGSRERERERERETAVRGYDKPQARERVSDRMPKDNKRPSEGNRNATSHCH
jgi:hypothetical protein